jgi:hypothetical protein
MMDFILLVLGLWLVLVVVILAGLHVSDPCWNRTKGDAREVLIVGFGFAAVIAGLGFFIAFSYRVLECAS